MNFLSFREFVYKYGLKNEGTSKVKMKKNLKTQEQAKLLRYNRVWNIHGR